MATNEQTIRAFLLQKADKGSNASGSIFFEGEKLYSYGHHFLMAVRRGRNEVVVTTRKYSITTSKQTGKVCNEANRMGYIVTREEL